MSQVGCVGSGNKLQKQRKGACSLGERKAKGMSLGEEKRGGKGMGVLPRDRAVLGPSP